MLKKIVFSSLFFLSLTGCNTLPETNLLKVSKSLQSNQCENSGIDISILKEELNTKNINVYSQSIGDDGIMRPQVCGAPDGKIAIFSIHKNKLNEAKGLGFKLHK